MLRVMRLFVSTSLLVLAMTLPSSAQTGLATVTGLVTDNSGAAVPGVTVTATNQATNVDYTGISNEAGAYLITGVPIGTYIVSSALTGFKSVQSNVSLSAQFASSRTRRGCAPVVRTARASASNRRWRCQPSSIGEGSARPG